MHLLQRRFRCAQACAKADASELLKLLRCPCAGWQLGWTVEAGTSLSARAFGCPLTLLAHLLTHASLQFLFKQVLNVGAQCGHLTTHAKTFACPPSDTCHLEIQTVLLCNIDVIAQQQGYVSIACSAATDWYMFIM